MAYPKLTPILATGTTTPRYLCDRFADTINVMDFGAKGDGVTDDQPSIQAAFDMASSNGKTVYIPAGTYNISRMLTFYSGVAVIGDNKNSIIKRAYETWDDSGGNPHTLMANISPISGEDYAHDIVMHGITFDAQGSTYDGIGLDIIATSTKTKGLEISHCRFLDVYEDHALDLGLVSDVHIHHCDFYGFKPDPNTEIAYREAIQFDINTAESDEDRTKNVIIEYCRFGASENLGPWLSAIGNHGFPDSDIQKVFSNVVVRNNWFSATDDTAPVVRLYIFDNVIIEENYFERCPTAISLIARTLSVESSTETRSNHNVIIEKNYINGGKSQNNKNAQAILIDGYKQSSALQPELDSFVTIAKNKIENCGYFLTAANDSGVAGFVISGNSFEKINTLISTAGAFISFIFEHNNIFDCGAMYFGSMSSSQFDTPADQRYGFIFKNNVWVDPVSTARILHLQGANGVLISNNIIYDKSTTKTGTYIEINAGAGAVGAIVDNNIAFSSSSSASNIISSTVSGAILTNNLLYKNKTLAS